MAEDKEIGDELKRQGFKKVADVNELCLSHKSLTHLSDLSRFHNLNYLWLNGNKLKTANFLKTNYRLTELYLNNNKLKDITGCLFHLSCLQTLFLNNNQLTSLENSLMEFRRMTCLLTLNLFHNPLSQELTYRTTVIHHVQSIQLLDRCEVKEEERAEASRHFEGERERVRLSVAFGRRAELPPTPCWPAKAASTAPSYEVANHYKRSPREHPEEAVVERVTQRSLMELSLFDWINVPTTEQKRRDEKKDQPPRLIAIHFR
ncbi:leucine-rich repeat-containing protein 72 isoform X1 [Lethenteron reissneri]|uniref:leucine-rich repeat-containing protein 72 isoform X1 n=1 Tax=Lethenteron reissneri TaxID=7753 RepID=UPI002AB6A5EB|nr:leucine-rich repeat-containing protein 72 isoform X1 [Lethenteron reissneri]